jgi:hypothetical protein
MATSGQTHKNVFKQIFADGWAEFKRNHPRYEAVDEVVQKMLGCGDPANGHAIYVVPTVRRSAWSPSVAKASSACRVRRSMGNSGWRRYKGCCTLVWPIGI